eukprot:5015008-Prymnesium_polylepis.1
MVRMLRHALSELTSQRAFMATVLAQLSEGWAAIDSQRRAIAGWEAQLQAKVQAQASARRAAEDEAARLR